MDAGSETVANVVGEMAGKKGLRHAFDTVMTGMLSVCDRQELHAVVLQWAEENAVLALPPLDGSEGSSTHDYYESRSTSSDEDKKRQQTNNNNNFKSNRMALMPVSKPQPAQPVKKVPMKPTPKTPNRRHPAPRCPPWLAHAGLPTDGSIPSSSEITAFANFVGATNSEVSARSSMRMSLQKLVQLLVCQEAILKVIGGWASGLATFTSTLDLVVEAPTETSILDQISTALRDLGVLSEFKMVSGFSALRLSSDALASAVWGQQQVLSHTSRQVQQGFDVLIFSECPGSTGPFNSRSATTRISSRLNKYPGHKKTAIVIRSIIEKTNIGEQQGGVNGFLILLMFVAFLEEHKTHSEIADSGWVLRQFFQFYSSFSYKTRTIVPIPSPGTSAFIPKVDPQSQLSIMDPLGTSGQGYTPYNVAAGVTKLNQLTGTLQYINMLILRYDKDPRGTPLLPNLVACGESLWKRHAWLRKGLEVTKPLAVSVAQCVADFLENPANLQAKEELVKIAAWEPMDNSLTTKLQLITKVVNQQNSPLAHFREHVPQLVEALAQYKDVPEVQEHYRRSVKTSVTREFVITITREIADFITDPANCKYKAELMTVTLKAVDEETANERVTLLLEKVAERPGSVLKEFRPVMKSLLNTISVSTLSGDEELDKQNFRILQQMVTPEMASRVAAEAADFLEELAKSDKRDEFMKQLIGNGEWSPRQNFTAYIRIFNQMKMRGGTSVLSGVSPSVIPVLAKVLDEFSDYPEVRENRRRAAAASFTKDLAVAIKKDTLAFIARPDNERFVTQLKTSHKDINEELLRALCNEPGSRLSDFRGEKGMEELNCLLKPFNDDPELLVANQQIAESVFANLRLED